MSISENIGFLTNWRKRVVTNPEFNAMLNRMRALSRKVPTGDLMWRLVKGLNAGISEVIVPDMLFWSEMGFQYIGPIDGHDQKQLEQTLNQARTPTGYVPLIHVVTHKGHGYEPAEDDPVKFHQPSSPLGSGTGAPTYSKGVRAHAGAHHARGPLGGGHQRGHAGGHGAGRGAGRVPGTGCSTWESPSSTPSAWRRAWRPTA